MLHTLTAARQQHHLQVSKEGSVSLREQTLFAHEKDNLLYRIALADRLLHGIDNQRLWHGKTLTGRGIYAGLYPDATAPSDVALAQPGSCNGI
jgi:type I restriction-modification system DNA methylase subunit